MTQTKKALVTGAAGFIGFHLVTKLLQEGWSVLGVDNLNPYYSPILKRDRLERLKEFPGFRFAEMSLSDVQFEELHCEFRPDCFVHLAAQAGVRYSIDHPWEYIDSNIIGFQRVLEALRKMPVQHFIMASSSSVYGKNPQVPYKIESQTDSPVSLYAATKKANEVFASSYASLYGIPTTALRFFTVYGSWGRPDMAYFTFTRDILSGKPIQVFNHGDMKRDFTHYSDIVESIVRLMPLPPKETVPYRILNIGASSPVPLMDFIHTIEKLTGHTAKLEMKPMQKGDVPQTFADTTALEALTQFKPQVSLEQGLEEFIRWFQDFDVLRRYQM